MFPVLFIPLLFGVFSSPLLAQASPIAVASPTSTVAVVPFYSQFKDIESPVWQKVGCGVASLAMIIDYYKPAVPVDTLLTEGISAGAYLQSAGWTYKGLIGLAGKYGLHGKVFDLGKLDSRTAFDEFRKQLKNGPLIASVHYKFDPKSTIPHLVVIDGIEDGMIVYNDPAANAGAKKITLATFLAAWKKRFIVLSPSVTVAKAEKLSEVK